MVLMGVAWLLLRAPRGPSLALRVRIGGLILNDDGDTLTATL